MVSRTESWHSPALKLDEFFEQGGADIYSITVYVKVGTLDAGTLGFGRSIIRGFEDTFLLICSENYYYYEINLTLKLLVVYMKNKVLIKVISFLLIFLLLTCVIWYLFLLKNIPIKFDVIDASFSNKIAPLDVNLNVQKESDFKFGIYKGNYSIHISSCSKFTDTSWQKLSDGSAVHIVDWHYSDYNGQFFPPRYICWIQYENNTHTISISVFCNLPNQSIQSALFNEIVSSINSFAS